MPAFLGETFLVLEVDLMRTVPVQWPAQATLSECDSVIVCLCLIEERRWPDSVKVFEKHATFHRVNSFIFLAAATKYTLYQLADVIGTRDALLDVGPAKLELILEVSWFAGSNKVGKVD
ncbi:hypothetical protein FVEN_g9619 [Fusarium venenatum]|nr:hypothetical protein FVEN_g9619 [Fusarium venenatum]